MTKPRIYSSSQIRQAYLDDGFPDGEIHIKDNWLVLPTQVSFMRVRSPVEDIALLLGINFEEESFDCDNWAQLAVAIANLAHRKSYEGTQALCAFIADGIYTGVGGHVIVTAIHPPENGGPLKPVYYEPQPPNSMRICEPFDTPLGLSS